MSSKTDAWMPLWIGAYLADTQHLTRNEHGGYLLMLMAYWRTGGPLQDDDKRLAAIVKATPKEWKALRPVLAEFFTVADGVWSHKRVEAELAASMVRKEKAASKAQAAAQARWERSSSNAPSNAPSIACSSPQALLEQCPTPSPSSISSSLRSEETLGGEPPKPPARRKAAASFALPSWVDAQAWAGFEAMRKASRKPMTDDARRLAVAKLADLRDAGQDVTEVLRQSTFRAWAGLFPVKGDEQHRAAPGSPVNRQEALEARNRAVGDEWLRDMEARDATQ